MPIRRLRRDGRRSRLSMAFTPGPNNIMVTASGVNFGFARTVPHMVGITDRLYGDAGAAALRVSARCSPPIAPLQFVLKIVGAAYMLWLAWKVANARPADDERERVGAAADVLASRGVSVGQSEGAGDRVQRDRDLCPAEPLAVRILPSCLRCSRSLPFLSTATWTGFGVALRSLLRNPPPCPHFQHRHGGAAGRQHRADGHLSHENIQLSWVARNQTL